MAETNQEAQWLWEYARTGSTQAFARLVEAHVGLVYSAAYRQLRDHHLAEDVTQLAFLALSRKARSLKHETVPAAWLLVTTRYLARDAKRSRARRAARELKAADMAPTTSQPPDDDAWDAIEPLLDEAMCSLSASDRRAITLRYLQNRSVEQVAEALGVSRDAAAQRIHRAIGRMRTYFERRGVAAGSAALGSLIAAHAMRPPPPHLAAGIVKAAAVWHASAHAGAGLFTKGAVMAAISTKAKVLATAAIVALTLGGTATVVYRTTHPTERVVVIDPNKATTDSISAAPALMPAAPAGGWRATFNQLYSMQPGETVKRIAPPYIPERETFFKDMMKNSGPGFGSMSHADSAALFYWDGQQANWAMENSSQLTFGALAHQFAGLWTFDFDGAGSLLGLKMPGDWIVRKDSTAAQRMMVLEGIANQQFGQHVHLSPRTVDRDVLVATGQYHLHPLPKTPFPNLLVIYLDKRGAKWQSMSAGSIRDFLGNIGELIGTKITVNDKATGDKQVFWQNYLTAKDVQRNPVARELLLKNLSEQMGLQFHAERRPVEIWFAQTGGPA
ncbi:MAG TPA: sigma-70 family RNA polymerase sigma factor [Tepidisphaeraceae bacterium]|nr:sigma-70 family RNA polymerase sigma factor [Tepidisphaeraceae bacterium]